MKRGTNLLAHRLVTAASRRPFVDNNTRSPVLYLQFLFLPRLFAYSLYLTTAD